MIFSNANLEFVKIIGVMADMLIVLQCWGADFVSQKVTCAVLLLVVFIACPGFFVLL